ncbi:hypothetical protein PPERSA_12607 [Pseudocohnilembus persalinus]|uniref:Uncharacterized protein n=1 Tax=Pseudocohnilembus persalinus TaxID=266149 RepID=A0A0V0QCS0_PSEPJ|nr:hypothetical protein PPERSA_12607 [Pseudocohnilembus persalinus]|eukprot:KRW99931.1 hypothetical protein PPERSA_12607 [Pseudocohnilembus persalinus]
MYMISTKQNNEFGIDGYDFPKKYFDPKKQVEDKKYEEYRKKNQWPKSNIRALKIKSHLEEIQESKKGIPAPNKYKQNAEWVSEKDKQKGKNLPKNTKKNTFIEQIINEQKLRSIPGVGKYNIRKTEEQVKKEIEAIKQKQKLQSQDRVQYLDTVMWYAEQVPGPGMYHPKKEVVKLKENNLKPEDWRKKHTAQDKETKKRSKSSAPGPGQYKNLPVLYNTFDKIANQGKPKTTTKYMGTEVRWKDPTKTKSVSSKPVPGPNFYDMRQKWPDAHTKEKKQKPTNYMDKISRGISRSIYY